MIHIAITVATLAVLVTMSVRYDRRRCQVARVPMQWSLSGRVNWTAPRRLGLAFTPTLAAIVLTTMIVASLSTTPRGGQYPLPILLFGSLLLIAAHALHLWLSDRTLDRAT